ncbi:MAG TPA: glycogen debranching protein GlgX [Rhodanobacteraceae bacterium]|nr:glycogen debranching protein GlgX [Rhodanobacteraceae bacterium]
MPVDHLLPGHPSPLGATWDGLGINFALFSMHAERVQLCLFNSAGRKQVQALDLPECTDGIWHGYLPDAHPGTVYGYRVHGPYEPGAGHRFNPNKLLLDPYARKLTGQLRWSDSLFGYRLHAARGDLGFDRRDSASAVPKAVVCEDSFNWGGDTLPRTPWADTVIYEAHVRGLTRQRQDIRSDRRGSFAAFADARFIDYVKRLGVTTIELLPIHAYVQRRSLVQRGLANYWGYNTLSFFAPEPRYLATGDLNEIRIAIRRLHAAGLEVILDVVYNHTCEGNERGPTLSFRGIDNVSYYRLAADEPRHYANDSGCGNTLKLANPNVLRMVLDSLRYWAQSFHVDGFRFDLCSALGREAWGFDSGAGFFDALMQDPVLSQLKLIAEPWDIGPGGYQLGNHPPGFAEWNDRFRDTVRRYWRGDEGQRGDLAQRLSGSSDIFDHDYRKPWASINFIASHDGFTLADVTAYAEKHNEANGEDNRDGNGNEASANWGVEGPSDDPAIRATRGRVQRAMLATLMLSPGTPMLLAGDEFQRSQQGNNNAYCQDNPLSWIDWSVAEGEAGRELIAFVQRLTSCRRRVLGRAAREYMHGAQVDALDIPNLSWFDEQGEVMDEPRWSDPANRCLALRRAVPRRDAWLVSLLLFNAGANDVDFHLPAPTMRWRMFVDSGEPQARERLVEGEVYRLGARSVALLVAGDAGSGA